MFPLWYRDTNGLALQLCTDTVSSPNVPVTADPLLTAMCVLAPPIPDPKGFAGNSGAEMFYNFLQVDLPAAVGGGTARGWNLRFNAQLEASYVPGPAPTRGQETVFARIRFTMNAPDETYLGQYVITHPFGVEVFDVTEIGPRALFATIDVPLGAALDFDGALNGRHGPFIEWDFVETGVTLDVQTGVDALGNPVIHSYVGDPNILHTFTGSPFGTNFVEVQGPPTADLGQGVGAPVNVSLGVVSGLKYPGVIPAPLKVDRAVYATPAGSGIHTIDIWASSSPGQTLIATGTGLPSIKLREPPQQPGSYYGHIQLPSTTATPTIVNVTNVTLPLTPSATAGQLTDLVEVALSSFDPATRVLTVNASTSDTTGPALAIEARGILPTAWVKTSLATPGAYTFTASFDPTKIEPPALVKVTSAAGGLASSGVSTLVGSPTLQPDPSVLVVAVNDGSAGAPITWTTAQTSIVVNGVNAPISNGGAQIVIPVLANDTRGNTASRVLLMTPPHVGAVYASNATGGQDVNGGKYFTYTAAQGSTAIDSFTYVVENGNGVSNVATVFVQPPLIAGPPSTLPDAGGMLRGTTKSFCVLANDTPATGTTLSNATLQVVSVAGTGFTATVSAAPTAACPLGNQINVTAASTVVSGSAATITYRVAAAGSTNFSTNTTLRVLAFSAAEQITYKTVQYTARNLTPWSIIGSSTWFDAALGANTSTAWYVDCTLVTSGNVAQNPPKAIARGLIDGTNKFQIASTGPVPTSPATIRCTSANGGTATASVVFK